jgi:choline dehydrogenase-like flavoprotein
MRETTDILVIGSGAGGAPIALEMSRAGFDVVVLEKGPRYSRADFRIDDIQSVTEPNQFVPDVRNEPHVLCHNDGRRELTTLGWIACCVGGGTAHMGARRALARAGPGGCVRPRRHARVPHAARDQLDAL